jgi:hypothetical protein
VNVVAFAVRMNNGFESSHLIIGFDSEGAGDLGSKSRHGRDLPGKIQL